MVFDIMLSVTSIILQGKMSTITTVTIFEMILQLLKVYIYIHMYIYIYFYFHVPAAFPQGGKALNISHGIFTTSL